MQVQVLFPALKLEREIVRAFQTVKKPKGELERVETRSNFNRAQRRVRWARGDFFGGKSYFPERKSLPYRFCGRNSKNSSKIWRRVLTRAEFARSNLWRADSSSECAAASGCRHGRPGELAPSSTSVSFCAAWQDAVYLSRHRTSSISALRNLQDSDSG